MQKQHTHKESKRSNMQEWWESNGESQVPSSSGCLEFSTPSTLPKCSPAPSETPVLGFGTIACAGFKAIRENTTRIYVQNWRCLACSSRKDTSRLLFLGSLTPKTQEDYWGFIHFYGSLPGISKHRDAPELLTSPRRKNGFLFISQMRKTCQKVK